MKKYEVTHYQINISDRRRDQLALHMDPQNQVQSAEDNRAGINDSAVFRLAFLTDLHNQANAEETEFILHILKTENVDAVLCGGDMIIAHPGHSVLPGLSFMKKLAAYYTVYAATGNHEYRARLYPEQYGSMYEDYFGGIRRAGIHVLENACEDTVLGGIPLRICGFDMPAQYYRRFHHIPLPKNEISNAIGEPDPSRLNILLAHNPAGMQAYFNWGADLTLCGHYHGGVMRWGNRRGSISPDFRIFPKAHGLYEQDHKNVIISAGCGEHTIPVRINNPREIVILQFHVNLA